MLGKLKMRITFLLIIFSLVFNALTACTTYPRLIAPEQPQDHFLRCQDIREEISINNKVILQLDAQQQRRPVKNFIAGLSGLFFAVPWFFLDNSDEEVPEKLSLEVRNQRLLELGTRKFKKRRCCFAVNTNKCTAIG